MLEPPHEPPAGVGAGSAPGGGVACDALLATALASRKLYSSAMSEAMSAVGSPPASRLGMAEEEEDGPIGGEEKVEEEEVEVEVVEEEEEGTIVGACPIACIRLATLAVSRSRAAEICTS